MSSVHTARAAGLSAAALNKAARRDIPWRDLTYGVKIVEDSRLHKISQDHP
jgi:hypothetical protein